MSEASTDRLAVLGSPIQHSRSPAIHAAAYAELGLAWSFDRNEVSEPHLQEFLESRLAGFRGFAVTMPLKKEAHRIASILDPVATESGVVNTLMRLDSDHQPWAGFNTDVPGLASALGRASLDVRRTVVLGAGATAVSAILAARSLGAEHITVCARRREAAEELAGQFDGRPPAQNLPMKNPREQRGDEPVVGCVVEAASWEEMAEIGLYQPTTLTISTLPGSAGSSLDVPEPLLHAPLYDVAYDPWPSPLAESWRAAGQVAHSGLSMLVEQAVFQIRIFVNGDPSRELEREERVRAAMYAAVAGVGD